MMPVLRAELKLKRVDIDDTLLHLEVIGPHRVVEEIVRSAMTEVTGEIED